MNQDAPVGVHPLVWLAIFLLLGPPALLSKTAAKLPWIFGWAGRHWRDRAKRQKAAADPVAEAERQSSASHEISQAEIKRMARDYARLNARYNKVIRENIERDRRLDKFEDEMTEEKRIRWAAIGYIRVLLDSHRKHAPESEIPEPPDLLTGIL